MNEHSPLNVSKHFCQLQKTLQNFGHIVDVDQMSLKATPVYLPIPAQVYTCTVYLEHLY